MSIVQFLLAACSVLVIAALFRPTWDSWPPSLLAGVLGTWAGVYAVETGNIFWNPGMIGLTVLALFMCARLYIKTKQVPTNKPQAGGDAT